MSSTGLGRVAIVGAGLAGSLLAILLGRRGVPVDLYERRGDPRARRVDDGRSINLGISARGACALREVGLWDELAGRMVPMRGRMVHRVDGTLRFYPYGTRPDQILHSIDRNELNAALVDRAEKYESVRCHFQHRCAGLDRDTGRLDIVDETGTGRTAATVTADLVVGADGAYSTVRAALQRGGPASHHVELLGWGYREVTIPAQPDGSPRTPLAALHVWPSRYGLVVAHPNRDASLTGTVLLPHQPDPDHPASFATLPDQAAADAFFQTTFPDLPRLVPDLAAQFTAHPTGQLVTIRTEPWHHQDRVVLVGDACHAVYPFYGQGMNSSFEDCLVLDECLRQQPADRAAALAHYQQLRKPHTDTLADLSAANFVELRDRLRSPWHAARHSVDLALYRLAPRLWQPLYTMVSHTTVPYAEALRRARRQDRLLAGALAAAGGGVVLAAAAAAHRLRARGWRQ